MPDRKAVITVTLANEGDNAYRPDVYLKNIIVERSITKSSAPYSFRATKDGKIVANKKEELSRILDHFGIHVDSPLTILTQDRARSFLQSSDPSSLYKVRRNHRPSIRPLMWPSSFCKAPCCKTCRIITTASTCPRKS